MKKVFKVFVDFDKEEDWLNQMADEGNLVNRAGPLYSFTPIDPGSALVRIDYRPSMSAADFDDYRTLFFDAGWQLVSGSRTSGNQYFASNGGGANAEIFSEAKSKAQRYRRALGASATLALTLLAFLIILGSTENPVMTTLSSPSEWYLTPGLWDKQGWAFVGAFLFETPFVAMRLSIPIILIAAFLVFLGRAVHQSILYRRATRNSQLA